jgi:hypothetical protein
MFLIKLVPMDINNILEQLKQERDRISAAIAALEGHSEGNGRRGRRPGRKQKTTEVGTATAFPFGAAKPKRRRRKVSAAVKRRLSEAAKARWAKAKKAGKNSL